MIARTLFLLALCLPFIARAAAPQGDEMTLSQISPYDFAQTRQRLLTALQARQLTLFAELDHAAAAQQNGLTMPPTTVLVFGNPKGGHTPDVSAPLPGAGSALSSPDRPPGGWPRPSQLPR